MDIHDCSSTTNSTTCSFLSFPPPSIPQLINNLHHHHHHHHNQSSSSSSWTACSLPQPHHHLQHDHLRHPAFHLSPHPSSHAHAHGHGGFFKRVVEELHNASYDHHHLAGGFQAAGSDPDPPWLIRMQTSTTDESAAGGYNNNNNKMKAIAAGGASKSHSEAERRRRQRINNHLTNLRTLLPNTTKTDKASLLAEVIEHVKDLKRQTSIIAKQSPVLPSEIDELTIDNTSDEDGRMVIRASLCCEDRSDLLPDLIKTLKTLRLRTLKAEITTLGRRVKNVLFVTGEDHLSSTTYDINQQKMTMNHWINIVEDALTAIIDKTNYDRDNSSKFANTKRQRTNNIDIFEH